MRLEDLPEEVLVEPDEPLVIELGHCIGVFMPTRERYLGGEALIPPEIIRTTVAMIYGKAGIEPKKFAVLCLEAMSYWCGDVTKYGIPMPSEEE